MYSRNTLIRMDNLSVTCDSIPVTAGISRGMAVRVIANHMVKMNAFFKIICGLQSSYGGDIFVNDYNLRYNTLQFQEHLQFIQGSLLQGTEETVSSYLKQISLLWNGFDNSKAVIKHLNLGDYAKTKINQLEPEVNHMVKLSRILICKSKIWLLKDIDCFLTSKYENILHDLVTHHIYQQGIVIYNSKSDFLNDITISHIELS